MKTIPATTQRAAKSCPSPVAVWQMLLTRLLEQHYGLTLNDTPFSDETAIQEHITPVLRWLMLLTFWWKSTNWYVSIAEGLTVRNSHLIYGR